VGASSVGRKLLKGTTIGVDATTLEANAALRSIVRRDSGERYEEFLTWLAKESGIETPTRDQLAKLDRKRPKKGLNDDWTHPHDPDARITKMSSAQKISPRTAYGARGPRRDQESRPEDFSREPSVVLLGQRRGVPLPRGIAR
jgi:hypothetical protein